MTSSSTPTNGCATSPNPEVIAYLEAENAYADEQTAQLEPLRQKIFDEIKARTKETDLSVPTRRGDWWYYGRSFEGKQYGVQCRCPVGDPDDWTPPELDEHTEIPGEQVLLDENVEAEGHDFFSLGAASVSLDGNTLAFSVDVVGDERYTLQFKDLRTGELYDDDDRRHRRGRHLGGRQPHRLLRRRSTTHGGPTPCGGTGSAPGLPAEQVYHEARRAVLARRRSHPQRQVRLHRGGQLGDLGDVLRRRRGLRGRVHLDPAAARAASSTPSSTPWSAARTGS